MPNLPPPKPEKPVSPDAAIKQPFEVCSTELPRNPDADARSEREPQDLVVEIMGRKGDVPLEVLNAWLEQYGDILRQERAKVDQSAAPALDWTMLDLYVRDQ